MISSVALLVANCQRTTNVSDICSILRKPPEMQTETRQAIYKDRPVNIWIASIELDGRTRRCWN